MSFIKELLLPERVIQEYLMRQNEVMYVVVKEAQTARSPLTDLQGQIHSQVLRGQVILLTQGHLRALAAVAATLQLHQEVAATTADLRLAAAVATADQAVAAAVTQEAAVEALEVVVLPVAAQDLHRAEADNKLVCF